MKVQTSVMLQKEQLDFFKKYDINQSQFIRTAIDKLIQERDPEKNKELTMSE